MQKTFCDRCGREIPAGKVVSVNYSNPAGPCKSEVACWSILLCPEHLHLCPDCARDFNVFMGGRPLREETDAKEPTGSP